MSDELTGVAKALQEAITGAIQAESKMPLSFLVVAEYEDAQGQKGWSWAPLEGQTPVTSMGLVNLIGRTVDHQVHDVYFHEPEGEE